MLTAEKRRSDRLLLTIALQVRGVDANGESFKASARTVSIGRHGAQVDIPRPLRKGQTVRMASSFAQGEAEFRVVAPISASTEKGGHYGVECLDAEGNIWQIQFPAVSDGETADARALLECRMCHTVTLAHLTLGELEALRTAGILAKSCETCQAVTPARYAEIPSAKPEPGDGSVSTLPRLGKSRQHRRVCLQVPLGVRNLDGIEVTRTENVSRGGFCFTSEKDYEAGQRVMVVFPGNTFSRKVEIPAEIVWQQAIQGTKRKVYGMHCERPSD